MARAKPAVSPWRNAIVRYADEDPASLLANPQNWRTHPESQTAALKGSLTELGWIAPVIVNETTQHVVDGHARIGEAIARGEPTVPVAYVNLTAEQERLALASFDPIGAMAGRDDAQLTALLAGLTSGDAGLSALLRDLAPVVPKVLHDDDADLTPPAEPITQPGDLWLLGEHRLLCGDSTSGEDVARLMDGASPEVLIADPPYGMNLDTDYSKMPKTRRGFAPIVGDDHPFDAGPIRDRMGAVAEQFWFGADYYARTLGDTEHAGSWLVWDKRVDAAYDAGFGSGFELIWSGKRRQRRVLRHQWFQNHAADAAEASHRQHPTQKPSSLIAELVSMAEADLVLDLFGGSGSTLVAAEQTGRAAYLMEIAPGYCDVIVRRWENLTGRKAVRNGSPIEANA